MKARIPYSKVNNFALCIFAGLTLFSVRTTEAQFRCTFQTTPLDPLEKKSIGFRLPDAGGGGSPAICETRITGTISPTPPLPAGGDPSPIILCLDTDCNCAVPTTTNSSTTIPHTGTTTFNCLGKSVTFTETYGTTDYSFTIVITHSPAVTTQEDWEVRITRLPSGIQRYVDIEITSKREDGTSVNPILGDCPLDLVFSVDISGSMHYTPDASDYHAPSPNSRMDHVKEALDSFWPLLKDYAVNKGRMGLAVFPGEPFIGEPDPLATSKIAPLMNITGSSIDDMEIAIDGLDPHLHHGRGTPMTAGLTEATGQFTLPSPDNEKVIFLITDGAHNRGTPVPEELVDAASDDIIANNIKIFALGYGIQGQADVDLPLLSDDLVPNTSGKFYAYDDVTANVDPEVPDLPSFFRKMLVDALQLQFSADPRDRVTFGEVKEHQTYITEFDRKTSFICSWSTPARDQLNFSLVGPDSTIINPAVARRDTNIFYHAGNTYKIYTIDPRFFASPGKIGPWILRVAANFDDSKATEEYSWEVMGRSNLVLENSLDKGVYYTGDDIEFTARLTTNGVGMDSAQVFVQVRRPEEGAGNWHHQNPVDMPTLNREIPRDSVPDRLSDVFRKASYLTNRLKIPPPSKSVPLPDISLTNFGNGIYRGTFQGQPNGTIKIGTYNFTVIAEGTTEPGNKFRREQFIQKYISALPAPSQTEITVEYLEDKDNFTFYRVKVIPRDKFGNYFGPGVSKKIELESTSGQFVEDKVQDDLNGNYVQTLRVHSEEETPIIRTRISKVSLPIVSPVVHPGKLDRFGMSIYNGYIWYDALGIDGGVSIGVQLGYNFGPRVSIIADFGAVPTRDKLEKEGTVINGSANLVCNLRNPRTEKMVPYLIAGLGISRFDGFTEDDQTVTYNVGSGVKFKLSRRVQGQFQVQNYIITSNGFNDKTTHNLQVIWGVRLSF